MAEKDKPNVVFARTSAVVAHAGKRIQVRAGEAWDGNDPLVASHRELFADAPHALRNTTTERGFAEVEQATQAPGEKRGTKRAR